MRTFRSGGVSVGIAEGPAAGGAGKPVPALVVLHGAGGSLSYWLNSVGEKLAMFGVATYAPHYFERTGTKRADAATILDGRHFPLWLETVRDAVTYVAERPEVDARRIAVIGISLGGYLAMATAVEDARVAATVELSGGMPDGWSARVHAGMRPVLLLHGEQDMVVPVSEAHRAAGLLAAAGVQHELKVYPGQGHWLSGGTQLDAMMTAGRFLARHLVIGWGV